MQNAPRLYVVFWDWTADPGGEAPYLTNFLSTVATNPWLATVNQYGGNSAAVLLAGTGTSPSIAADVFGGYEVAAQASTGNLWTVNSATGGADLGLGMASGTSPSIAATNGSYEIAFQANTGFLWTVGLQNTAWGLGLLAGTSPAITAM